MCVRVCMHACMHGYLCVCGALCHLLQVYLPEQPEEENVITWEIAIKEGT